MYFDMETVPRIKHRKRGLISMVNNGNNGHGSQVYIESVYMLAGRGRFCWNYILSYHDAVCHDFKMFFDRSS